MGHFLGSIAGSWGDPTIILDFWIFPGVAF